MKKYHPLILLLIIPVLSFTSCYTDPDPGVGKVTVLDQHDFRVPGAEVTFSQAGQNNTGIVLYTTYSDNNGEASYTYVYPPNEMALPVIADVDVTKDNLSGTGIVRIDPGKTAAITVHLYP